MLWMPPEAITGILSSRASRTVASMLTPRQHAVAADVGVDDRLDAVVLEFLGQIDDVVAGHLRPAVGRDLAFARVEADDDVAGERRAGIVQEAGVLHRGGADDDVADAVVEIALDRVEVANAAAQLDRDLLADHADDLADRALVLRLAGERAVQVDEMQALAHPARANAAPSPPGSSENTVADCISPCLRRTQ